MPRDTHVSGNFSWGGTASGDGSGIMNADARKLRGRTVGGGAPSNGQVLGWNPTTAQWEPQAAGATVSGGNATQLQGRAVSAAPLLDGQTLVYNTDTNAWGPGFGGGPLDVTTFGAAADAEVFESCSMTAGGATVTCAGASFDSSYDGKKAAVAGAGPSGATVVGTISGASGTTFTLSAAPRRPSPARASSRARTTPPPSSRPSRPRQCPQPSRQSTRPAATTSSPPR